ncbi:MAG: penicillin-binding protein 2 [Coriobacteriales bacterium]|nr:penicillin-binding protein 2 [Coriobacteriales bacterium]
MTLTIIIAVAVFVVVFVSLVIAAVIRAKRQKNDVVRKGFVRHGLPEGLGEGEVRKFDTPEPHKKAARRGRLYAFGLVITGIFGTIAMRLWSLQMISGSSYQKLAEENMTSEVSIPATRGRILDRNGVELVGNRASLCITAPRRVVDNPIQVHLLSLLLGIPKGIVRYRLLNDVMGAQANRELATDVPMHVVTFIREHQQLFSGVEITERTVRTYPHGSLAAHTLGYIGTVTEADLLLPNPIVSYEGGDRVGKSGAEFAFENVLQGTRGARTYRVDSVGTPIALLSESPPQNGSDVCLTIDLELQKEAERILSEVIISCHMRGFYYADAGALVCIDIEDGGILASASYPTFNPENLANGISEELWQELTREGSGYPLTNRVIAGMYPAASTFKAFTALAGLEYGVIAGNVHTNCTGFWDRYGEAWGKRCWIFPNGHGYLGLEEAINQSCDTFFYEVGANFFDRWQGMPRDARVDELQDYLRTWGFGSTTGVDIPGEARGRVPDEPWKLSTFSDTPEPAQWQGGDMANMCIGQGDILVTPLQIANGYAGIARKKMVKPHFFHHVLNNKGEVIVEGTPEDSEIQPTINDAAIGRVVDGLRRVVNRTGGLFHQLPVQVAGKSGTAEVPPKKDFSWFVAFAPAAQPKYCVACLIEQAGDGSSAALLGVQHMLAAIYGIDAGEIIVSQGSGER